jgi:tRNA A-37 threonylcarbamoyl transferase component Bud32
MNAIESMAPRGGNAQWVSEGMCYTRGMTEAEAHDPRGTLERGASFAGDYTVVRVIAAGGMGSVYEVVQRNTAQTRALKVLHRWLADDDRVRQRFIDEARLGSRIDSEHVVQVIDAGIAMPEGVPWYVMEYLRGETLEELVTRRGPLPVGEALALFDPIAHAVGAAHRAGIVHCDLKPENLHVAESRRVDAHRTVKVLDFGIAHVLPALKASVEVIMPHGSPGWLAPEQMTHGGHVTLATDVWALGLIAFYALTGGSYWRWFDHYPAILAEIEGAPLEPASVRAASLHRKAQPPPGFDEWFARCVDRDPARRFRDATACLDALHAILTTAARPSWAAAPMGSAHDAPASRVRMLQLALNEGERRGEVEARIRIGEELLAHGATGADVPARTAAAYVARAWSREQSCERGAALDDARRAAELAPRPRRPTTSSACSARGAWSSRRRSTRSTGPSTSTPTPSASSASTAAWPTCSGATTSPWPTGAASSSSTRPAPTRGSPAR